MRQAQATQVVLCLAEAQVGSSKWTCWDLLAGSQDGRKVTTKTQRVEKIILCF